MNKTQNLKVFVLGASGMIGSEIFRVLDESINIDATGVWRSQPSKDLPFTKKRIIEGIDIQKEELWRRLLIEEKPHVVINCIGITKHHQSTIDARAFIGINSIFPYKLSNVCDQISARLIHISTDCIFSGKKGFYSEEDISDSEDLYGLTKKLGEINTPNHLTLRTSTVGHEISTKNGLLEWFLSQQGNCKGYKRAIFSGVTTSDLAIILRDKILPNKKLSGIYNISSDPISKYDLLQLMKRYYSKQIEIEEDTSFIIDRSLNGEKFKKAVNHKPESWEIMIKRMALAKKEKKIV
jgi:dTDP-4-dehydrorhamnose reductase